MAATHATLLFAVTALALAAPGWAQPAFKNRQGPEKEFMAKVGEATVKAVRAKPAGLEMEWYTITTPMRDRKAIDVKMIWHGALTKRKYTADIRIIVDSTNQNRWEVLEIRYGDDCPATLFGLPHNLKKLKEQFNR